LGSDAASAPIRYATQVSDCPLVSQHAHISVVQITAGIQIYRRATVYNPFGHRTAQRRRDGLVVDRWFLPPQPHAKKDFRGNRSRENVECQDRCLELGPTVIMLHAEEAGPNIAMYVPARLICTYPWRLANTELNQCTFVHMELANGQQVVACSPRPHGGRPYSVPFLASLKNHVDGNGKGHGKDASLAVRLEFS
jgi:hypothetical protein